MTSIVSESSRAVVGDHALSVVATELGAIVVLLTIGLVTAREVLRAGSWKWDRSARGLDVAILPLLLASGYVILVRMLDILGIL